MPHEKPRQVHPFPTKPAEGRRRDGLGQCGACTVMLDEGLGRPGKLHPMQAAFVKHDGYQSGRSARLSVSCRKSSKASPAM
jgi:aerobic-type carbon monoxide dehydrogenase small subunit (CoxS/CutS family)